MIFENEIFSYSFLNRAVTKVIFAYQNILVVKKHIVQKTAKAISRNVLLDLNLMVVHLLLNVYLPKTIKDALFHVQFFVGMTKLNALATRH